jgi:hypothetical protein
MERGYGYRRSKPGFTLGIRARYLITFVVGVLGILIPRFVHDRALVGIAEGVLWLGFIAWVVFGQRREGHPPPKD